MDFIIIKPLRSEIYFENIKLWAAGEGGVEVEHLRSLAQVLRFLSSEVFSIFPWQLRLCKNDSFLKVKKCQVDSFKKEIPIW